MRRTLVTVLSLAALLVLAGVASAAAADLKIGVLDVEYVVLKSNKGQAAKKKLQRTFERKQKELDKKITAVSQKRDHIAEQHASAVAQLDMIEIDTEIHERIATAFSCLTFALLGIPLGLMTRRGNIMIGFAVSFLVVLLLYYPLVLGGQVLIFDKYLPIPPLVWAANAVLAVLGIALLARVFRQ